MISGDRNSENGSAIFLEPETDVMVQFLASEMVIMGERNISVSVSRLETLPVKPSQCLRPPIILIPEAKSLGLSLKNESETLKS